MIPENGKPEEFKQAVLGLLGETCYVCENGCIPVVYLPITVGEDKREMVGLCDKCSRMVQEGLIATHTPLIAVLIEERHPDRDGHR